MLELIALNYTVMLNGHRQRLNIQGKKNYFIETSVVLISVILAFNHKTFIECEIIAI